MNGRGEAFGKLILFGEHAAVWGYPASGLPLPGAFRLTRSNSMPEDGRDFEPVTGDDLATIKSLLPHLEEPELNVPGCVGSTWYSSGRISRTGGFGSSAALCVALARLCLDRAGTSYDPEVHRLANRLEHHFHGTPSGIDTGMASDNRPAAWRERDNDVPLREPLDPPECFLAVGSVPRVKETALTVGAIGARMRSGDSRTMTTIDELGDISERFIRSCGSAEESPEAAEVFAVDTGRLADRAQACLADLGLSTHGLEAILNHGRRAGALGGKLSGGGTGGAFWMIFPDRESRDMWIKNVDSDEALKRLSGLTDPMIALNTASMYPLTGD